jgi:hypothetical protein
MIVEKRQSEGLTLLIVEGVIKLGESAQFFAQTLERALAEDAGHVIDRLLEDQRDRLDRHRRAGRLPRALPRRRGAR